MKKHRILGVVLLLLLFQNIAGTTDAEAAKPQVDNFYNIEQVVVKSPVMHAYINGRNIDQTTEYKLEESYQDKSLRYKPKGKTEVFSHSKEGMRYVILLDDSMSVDMGQFSEAKNWLTELRKGLRKNDSLRVVTVGTVNASGQKRQVIECKGNASKSSVSKDIRTIRDLSRNKRKTVLYRSLDEVFEEEKNNSARTVIVLLTDGEDDSRGKYNRSYEMKEALHRSSLPVYGILMKNSSSFPNKHKINITRNVIFDKKDSHGYFEDRTYGQLGNAGKNIETILMDQTYVVSFQEEHGSNRPYPTNEVKITPNGDRAYTSTRRISYNSSGREDQDAPVLKDVKKKTSASICFFITDDTTSNILGAEDKKHYTLREKKSGKKLDISDIKCINSSKGEYELLLREALYSGKYILTCNGITDNSVEKNNVVTEFGEKSAVFSLKGKSVIIRDIKDFLKNWWWLVSLLAIGGIVAVAVRKVNKRRILKETRVEVDPELSSQPAAGEFFLKITEKDGTTYNREMRVEGSFFVGRKEGLNDLSFPNDSFLSRQHFVIAVTKGGCIISHLGGVNKTYVNGVLVEGGRKLENGDEINAGNELIVFSYRLDDTGTIPFENDVDVIEETPLETDAESDD